MSDRKNKNGKPPGRYMHGKTCAKCRHFPRCAWLVQAKKTWTYCDWAPPRFEAAVVPVAKPARGTGAAPGEGEPKS